LCSQPLSALTPEMAPAATVFTFALTAGLTKTWATKGNITVALSI